jgi:hypothetical protein
MDHSAHHAAMDHGNMDHGGHGGHGAMDMCNMNASISLPLSTPQPVTNIPSQMLFTWDTTNLCIVFKWWHIRSPLSLTISLLAVVALVAGYEALRESIRRYEVWVAKRADTAPRKSPSTRHLCVFWIPQRAKESTHENPSSNQILKQPRCGCQGKTRSPSRTGRMSSSRCCMVCRISMLL